MEDWKENTKRRSKTFKRVIGHSYHLFPSFHENININTNDQNRNDVLRFVDKFLPEHSEMRNWDQGVDYSLKKKGRWKLLDKVKEAWQNQSEELALLEKEVTIDHLVSNVYQHRYDNDFFSQRFRNHGDIVQKSKITRGKKKERLQVWEEGDPSKVETISPAKPNRSYKSRFSIQDEKKDISIKIWQSDKGNGISRQKTPLKSHASDKYTRRSLQSRGDYVNRSKTKISKNKIKKFQMKYEGEEEEEQFSPSTNCFLPKGGVEVKLLDFMVSGESNTKRTKNKRKRRESCSSIEGEEQKKSKLIYIPKSNVPVSVEALDNFPDSETTLVEEINIHEISLDCFDIPLNSGWRVVYSKTEPTICEVWKGKTSLMFMLTSSHTAQVQVSTNTPPVVFDEHGETIASICQKLDKEPENNRRRDLLVCNDEDNKIDFYHPSVVERYLTVEDSLEESDAVDLSRMEMADWVHLGTECDICLCECQPLELGCGHSYCTSCWRRWLASPGGMSARCPHPGCPTILDIVAHHWLAGPRRFQETRAEMLTSRLASDPSVLGCRRCRRVARRRDLSVTRVTCVCRTGTCVRCGQEDHWPATCSELAKYTKFTAMYSDLKKLEEEVTVRGCPKCGLLWEKMWGCNHMVCGSCHISFCWGCGQDQTSHSNFWCGHITVPLETRTITPVPTEMVIMKQIELFIMAKTIRNQTREFGEIKSSKAKSLWMKSVVDTYNLAKQVLKYGLICDRVLKSKRLISKLQTGIASMKHLRELLKQTKQSDHWRSLVKLHVHNVKLATKSICKSC